MDFEVGFRERLKSHLKNNKDIFKNARPFPHVVIDNFLSDDHAKSLAKTFDLEKIRNSKQGWTHYTNDNADRHRLEDEFYMEDDLKSFARLTNSRYFILFLEELTGLKSLLGDPYFMGGGAMASETGGYLKMHIDYNWNAKLQLFRNLNFLIYLTDDWEKEWEGALDLHNEETDETKSVYPFFNRAIIFQSDSKSFHGQPIKLKCPKNKARTLFSSFYYSSKKLGTVESDPHFTIYKQEYSPSAMSIKL